MISTSDSDFAPVGDDARLAVEVRGAVPREAVSKVNCHSELELPH
jgi:hypothetical protein